MAKQPAKYKFWKRKDRGGIYYVCFAHSPHSWASTGKLNKDEALEWAVLNQETAGLSCKEWAAR